MNQSLVMRFEVISTMIYQIKESPEWAEYCTICNAGLTEEDDRYTGNERDLASIENAVTYLLSGISVDEAVARTIEQAVMFFLANGRFPDSPKQEEFPEFEFESEDAATPSIWDLTDS